MKKYILLAIVGLLLMSCFEDKGNYSYTVGEQITVSGVEKEYLRYFMNDRLVVRPEVCSTDPDARFEYLDEFVTASFYAGIAFLKAGCGPVHGMSFPLGGTYHVPHGESNYMLFGAIMDYYDANKPDGEIMKFKELVARILGCEVKDAIPEMNALLQRILPLRPLRDCGFTEADFKIFPQSVETNQQRLMTNAYYPFDLESEEAIYRKCY